MPRIKTELLQEGMVVVTDVKNMDGMLLIPAGCTLTERQVNILQAWGVEEIDVQQASETGNTDPLQKLAPDLLARLTAEIKALFWQADETNPVFAEIFKVMLQRRARRFVSE